jgi:kumamolisin
MATVILQGSERTAVAKSRVVGPADPAERLEVSIIVRRRAAQILRARTAALTAGSPGVAHLTREEFAAQHGADAPDMAAVRHFASSHDLSVVQEHAGRRTLVLAGTVAQFRSAFSVELNEVTHSDGTYRGRTGAIHLPAALDGIVEAVLGLDNRPQASPHFRLRSPQFNALASSRLKSRARASSSVSYTPTQVAALYGFPKATGKGQCVGIIELGGGFRPTDLKTYFTKLKVGSPKVLAVSVDHGKNAPTGSANGADGEVMLDIEVVGAVAPGATIAVYFAPNTDAGFLDAVTSAIHDTINKPSVISISWGSAESTWTAQAMTAMDDAFQAAASMGITVCVASGDNGSNDNVGGTTDHVDFPASSPFALGCGGTSLRASKKAITSEIVWNNGAAGGATGGGVSDFFPAVAWQAGISAKLSSGKSSPLKNRGVPDVAGNADPGTGYAVRIDGTDTVIGGTSAVAPLWAGLIARINQLAGSPVGYLNAALYTNKQALRDVTQGNNGDFAATAGWDGCTGLGSPDGKALLARLKQLAVKRAG